MKKKLTNKCSRNYSTRKRKKKKNVQNCACLQFYFPLYFINLTVWYENEEIYVLLLRLPTFS